MTEEEKKQILLSMSADVPLERIQLETPRLWLRPLAREDLADFHTLHSQPEVAAAEGWQCSSTLAESEKKLREYMEAEDTLAVVLKENGNMVGTLSLQRRNWNVYPIDRSLRGRELGFDLNKDYWGRGLMPEAVEHLCDFCFGTLDYDFLTAGYFQGNAKSERAIEKCGFSPLFAEDFPMPWGEDIHIITLIRYNPRKETTHV